ncbi:MAG: hypothetical protein OXF73_10870 [Gammaproteobacteria bacterium]|nr:hypothetical protein [Gammaproteobacteria bacterium]
MPIREWRPETSGRFQPAVSERMARHSAAGTGSAGMASMPAALQCTLQSGHDRAWTRAASGLPFPAVGPRSFQAHHPETADPRTARE